MPTVRSMFFSFFITLISTTMYFEYLMNLNTRSILKRRVIRKSLSALLQIMKDGNIDNMSIIANAEKGYKMKDCHLFFSVIDNPPLTI